MQEPFGQFEPETAQRYTALPGDAVRNAVTGAAI